MKEKDRIPLFLKWARVRYPKTFVFEAKIVKGKSIAFDEVKDHQGKNLFSAKNGLLNYKISDSAFGQKPFDGFQVTQVEALIALFWYEKPGDKRLALIDILDWLTEKNFSDKKSLTWERACEIGQCFEMA